MAFDGIARALLTGTAGFMQGRQQREEDEERRRKEKAQANLEAEAAKREAENDAVMNLFRQSQARANDALAHDRMNPASPAPKVSIKAGNDGTLYRVDETTGKATPVTRADGTPLRQRVPPVGGAPSASQNDQAAREEAEGLAIMRYYGTRGGNLTPGQRQIFWHTWSQAKKEQPGLSNGRVALMVARGLQRATPTEGDSYVQIGRADLGRTPAESRAYQARYGTPAPADSVASAAPAAVPDTLDGADEFESVLPSRGAPPVGVGPRPAPPGAPKVPISAEEFDVLLEQGYTEAELRSRFEVVE